MGRQKTNALLSGEKTDNVKGLNEKGDVEKKSVDLPSGLAANDAVRCSFVSLIVFSRWGVCLSRARASAHDLYQDKHTPNTHLIFIAEFLNLLDLISKRNYL